MVVVVRLLFEVGSVQSRVGRGISIFVMKARRCVGREGKVGRWVGSRRVKRGETDRVIKNNKVQTDM